MKLEKAINTLHKRHRGIITETQWPVFSIARKSKAFKDKINTRVHDNRDRDKIFDSTIEELMVGIKDAHKFSNLLKGRRNKISRKS